MKVTFERFKLTLFACQICVPNCMPNCVTVFYVYSCLVPSGADYNY